MKVCQQLLYIDLQTSHFKGRCVLVCWSTLKHWHIVNTFNSLGFDAVWLTKIENEPIAGAVLEGCQVGPWPQKEGWRLWTTRGQKTSSTSWQTQIPEILWPYKVVLANLLANDYLFTHKAATKTTLALIVLVFLPIKWNIKYIKLSGSSASKYAFFLNMLVAVWCWAGSVKWTCHFLLWWKRCWLNHQMNQWTIKPKRSAFNLWAVKTAKRKSKGTAIWDVVGW